MDGIKCAIFIITYKNSRYKESLTNSQKFPYLSTKLDGVAAKLVRYYAKNDANHTLAR